MLKVLPGWVVMLSFLGAPPCCLGEDVLFEDDFDDGLSERWQLVGLEKGDYRLRDGGLELRVPPGPLGRRTPMLKVVLPFTAADSVVASVRVTPLNPFTQQNEFGGVYLLDEEGREFAAKKELVGGRLVFSPGKYRFQGREGEEGAPAKYSVEYTEATDPAGPLRVVVHRGYAHFQVGPDANGGYQTFSHSAIREKTLGRGFCLTAAGAPEGAAHWVRFEDFRVVRK